MTCKLGISSLLLGIVGIVFYWGARIALTSTRIPYLYLAYLITGSNIIACVGLILGIVGVITDETKVYSIVGLVLSSIAFIFSLIYILTSMHLFPS